MSASPVTDTAAASQGPAVDESPAIQKRNARYGLILFCVYLALYGGFMAVNVIAPERMKAEALLGLNTAIVYGFVLIVFALVLALIYTRLCRRPAPQADSATGGARA